MSAKLTTEQAREFAQRWAACAEHVGRWGAAKYWAEPRLDAPVHGPIRAEDHVTQRPIAMPCEPLAPAECERLFAWVRGWTAGNASQPWMTRHLAETLEISTEEAQALRDAARDSMARANELTP